jgi:hypothetical protein
MVDLLDAEVEVHGQPLITVTWPGWIQGAPSHTDESWITIRKSVQNAGCTCCRSEPGPGRLSISGSEETVADAFGVLERLMQERPDIAKRLVLPEGGYRRARQRDYEWECVIGTEAVYIAVRWVEEAEGWWLDTPRRPVLDRIIPWPQTERSLRREAFRRYLT